MWTTGRGVELDKFCHLLAALTNDSRDLTSKTNFPFQGTKDVLANPADHFAGNHGKRGAYKRETQLDIRADRFNALRLETFLGEPTRRVYNVCEPCRVLSKWIMVFFERVR